MRNNDPLYNVADLKKDNPQRFLFRLCVWGTVLFLLFPLSVLAAEQGRSSTSKYPESFEPGRRDPRSGQFLATGKNVRWAVPIGFPTYATPVVANGKVLIGTLNNEPYVPERGGSRNVLLCFDEKTGEFLWELALPKNDGIPYFDSYCVGISSTPTVIGDEVFLTTGRGEVLCLDLCGLTNGNTGPYQEESLLYAAEPGQSVGMTEKDADIIWRYDMFRELNAKPHDTNNCQIIHDQGLLYVNTGNAPNYTHQIVEHPDAPAMIVLDAKTGCLLARDAFGIGNNISHGQWCSPTLANVNGVNYIFYGGGNGVLYAFETFNRDDLLFRVKENNGEPVVIPTNWTFHGDPRAQPHSGEVVPPFETKMGSASYTCLPPPAYEKERIFMLFGFDGWNGAKPLKTWLACLDARYDRHETIGDRGGETVDRTETALIWGTGNIEGGAITPITISNGLLYFADRKGNFYCYETESGQLVWTLPLKGDIWAKPLLVDGKIYIGTDRRLFYVLQAGRTPKILGEMQMPDRIFAPCAASEMGIYIAGEGFLYAIDIE
ncbi:MAG: PQQ-binding-like beta-propeller repeat protein [Thermoguttaceae bacterium]